LVNNNPWTIEKAHSLYFNIESPSLRKDEVNKNTHVCSNTTEIPQQNPKIAAKEKSIIEKIRHLEEKTKIAKEK